MTDLFANASATDHALALSNSLALVAALLLFGFIVRRAGGRR